jgi:Protein of unknown function (DUF2934)
MQELEQAIRERAYHLWVADGRRDGNADAHWLSAQREVLASSLRNFARVTVSGDVAPASDKAERSSTAKTKSEPGSRKKRRAA